MNLKDIQINLAAVRVNADMTQQEWANALGVDKSTIWNWENKKGEPSYSQLRKMSELSNIPMDCIFVQRES